MTNAFVTHMLPSMQLELGLDLLAIASAISRPLQSNMSQLFYEHHIE
jgi:hypothetical protein